MKKNTIRIGIMSGRLSKPINNHIQAFPQFSWKQEFEKAHSCGFESLEWVFDLYRNNPILDGDGLNEIKKLSDKYSIRINSVCADYFMEKMLFNVSTYELEKNLGVLKKLIKKCNGLEIDLLEIPLIDSSSLKTKNDKTQLILNLKKSVQYARDNNVNIILETDLPPKEFRDLIQEFNHPNIYANYDTGNSASLGYNVKEELEILSPWIKNVHIKDRFYQGNTTPLGTGDTNFDLFFQTLSKINYHGDLIIQGAREHNDPKITPEVTCTKYLKFVKNYVHKYL